jgi:methylase of polypeptide subunit release factors
MISRLCTHVIATDIAPTAVACAQRRCKGLENVSIYCADVAAHVPQLPLDLAVFSEIGYYFASAQRCRWWKRQLI